MTLLAYIKSCIAAAVEINSKPGSRHTGYSQTYKSLTLFLKDDIDATFLKAIDPDFVLDYATYLFSGDYAKDYAEMGLPNNRIKISERTLEKHLRTFRAIVRQAIAQGLLPPVDVFPLVFSKVADLYGIKAFSNDECKAKLPSARGYQKEFEKLVGCIARDLAEKNRARYAMPALVYVLGLYCNGKELAELLEITADSDSSCSIDLSERAFRILSLLNRNQPADGYLIRRHAGWSSLDSEKLANQLSLNIQQYFKTHGIKLFASQSILTDWLCFAKERSMPDNMAVDIAINRMPKNAIPAAYANNVANDQGIFVKRWHVLCSYANNVYSDKLKARLVRDFAKVGISFNAKSDFYDPQEKQDDNALKGSKLRSVLSKFLFVRCLASTANFVDKNMVKASLMRDPSNKRKFATISDQDIKRLALMLDDIREDMEITGLHLSSSVTQLEKGLRVRILSGPFKGFEGTIEDIKKSAAGDEEMCKVAVGGFSAIAPAAVSIKGNELDPF